MTHPYMPFYVSDYLDKTRRLTTEQHGAYVLLLLDLWENGGDAPNDPRVLARICHATPKRWSKIWEAIGHFFYVKDDRVRNERLDFEIQKADQIRAKRKTAGRKGGLRKALNAEDPNLALAKQKPEQKPPELGLEVPSEPNGSSKPSETNVSEPSAREIIFGPGLELLVRAGGATDKNARAALGKLCKVSTEKGALVIVQAMLSDPPGNPIAYIWGAIKKAESTPKAEGDTGSAPRYRVERDGDGFRRVPIGEAA